MFQRLLDIFPALRHRAFACFIMGQLISLLGQWMKRLAMSWLVFRLTSSAFLLGIVEFVSLAPILFLGLAAGAWLERHDTRKALIVTQVIAMALAGLLTFITYTGLVSYPLLVLISLILGLAGAFDMTARQTSVSLMVTDPEAVKSAVALNSMTFNICKLVGPSIAGIVVYVWGESVCFFIATVAYIPIIYMLIFQIRMRERESGHERQGLLEDMAAGLSHVRETFFMRRIFQLLAPFCLLAMCYTVLFPMFSTAVLSGGSQTLGWLLAAVGAGAFVGGFYVSAAITLEAIPRYIAKTALLTTAAMMLFSFSNWLCLSLAAAFCMGFGITSTNISINTLLQTTSTDDCRARVLGLYVMCTAGLSPVGGLASGALADIAGAPVTMFICAAVLLVCISFFRRDLPRIDRNLLTVLHP